MTSPPDVASDGPPPTFAGRLRLSDYVFQDRGSKRKAPDSDDTDDPASAPAQPVAPKSSPKKRRTPSTYAPPSTYAHLPPLPDALSPNLLVLFIGLNPSVQTARTGHAYAHPSNLFWRLLHWSGITPVPCSAPEDREMPARYALGFTNIVARPTRSGSELSRAEMDEGVAELERKARACRPESVCIVGKSIWESVCRVRWGRAPSRDQFCYGWQAERENMGVIPGEGDDGWRGARVFVATTTSGLAAGMSTAQKREIWDQLGVWVQQRRVEREQEEQQQKQET